MSEPEPERASRDEHSESERLDPTDQAIAACGGDLRSTSRSLARSTGNPSSALKL